MSLPPFDESGPGGRTPLATGDLHDVARAFEEMPAVLWAFEGPDHRVVAANQAARASIGNRPGIVGRPIREVIPEMAGQQIFEMIDEVYRTGRPVAHADRRVLVDRDGDGTLEEGFFTYTFLPTRDPDGSVRGMVTHIVETTQWVRQRQAAQAEAEASERRYQHARDVVLALQRSLLPPGVPVLPRLRLAARYLVADADAAAGGDWFDTVPLPDGRVALLVGDVVGHGAEAAAVMGQLRAVALQALMSGTGIADTLTRLDDLAARVPGARGATVFLAVLDTSTGELTYSSRAHPPPLVLDAAGPSRTLDGRPGHPVGNGGSPAPVHADALRPGAFLLLYTDGLIERPGRSPAEGLRELARVASAVLAEPVGADTTVPTLAADRLCTLVVERFGWSGYADDVTLLVAEALDGPGPPLRLEVPAVPTELAAVRRGLAGWLDALDAPAHQITALQHAVDEAASNAVEHAYDGPDGVVAMHGELDGQGCVRLRVADRGRWRQPGPATQERGRGLLMMRALVDAVDVASDESGTTITLTHQLLRPVLVGTSPLVKADRPLPPPVPFHTRAHPGRLVVCGPVDQVTAGEFERAVMHAARGGAAPVMVDLTEVTHLASSGVRVLAELATALPRDALRITADAGSPAEQILRLTGLDHLMTRPPAPVESSP